MTPLCRRWLVLLVTFGTAGGADGAAPGASPDPPAGWRGNGSGRFPSANPVTRWNSGENILWKAEVGAGQSSPIVAGRRLLITSEPDVLVCLDADTGRELWRKVHRLADVSPEAAAKGARHSSQYGDATPTPVSDGHYVWVFLGTGLVACHDLEGACRWMRWYDVRQTTSYGRTSSPVLAGDRLLIHFGPLVCLEAATGEVVWRKDDARAAYGTPAAARIGGVDVVITPKGRIVRVADGKTLAADLGNCMYTSPVVQGGVAYFIDGGMSAVRLPDAAGEQIECKELWSGELPGEFFASPVVHGGRIYTADKAGTYYVIDASTGKVILKRKIEFSTAADASGGSVYPSLCLPGTSLLVGNDAGNTIVLEPGDRYAPVGSGTLPGGSGGTPAFSGRRMYVRGGEFLYCVAGAVTAHSRGLHGYIGFSHEKLPGESAYSAGMGFYAAVWSLTEEPLADFQIGLLSSWITPDNCDNKDTPLAPEGMLARRWRERGPTWSSVFQTVEGGLGYWAGNHFRYGPPKFSMNATPQCYDYEIGSPGWSFFYSDEALPDDRLGIAQLSNRLLIPPDALPFQGNQDGRFLGRTRMALPFTDATHGDPPPGLEAGYVPIVTGQAAK